MDLSNLAPVQSDVVMHLLLSSVIARDVFDGAPVIDVLGPALVDSTETLASKLREVRS